MPDHCFSKEIFPNIESKPPLRQLEAIASRPIASHLREKTNTCLTTTSFQVVEVTFFFFLTTAANIYITLNQSLFKLKPQK